MYLDAPIETTEDSSTVITKAVLCGFMGNINGEMHPFVLRKDKSSPGSPLPYELDFGADYQEPFRFFKTNLPSKSIRKATQFTISMDFKEYVYEIREIIDLLRLQPLDSL
ncbi:hypothetical protein [Sinorhizobium fredii]|uniref:hypothetical protein n=1 Tax=Rhizobium fredii TaxID=380 RepID=UPI0004ADB0EE|nr:hypothetical protein [Sinorhizobium fredii]AWM28742.1 hypothetical protein AOX55_00005967 [Sinorhizobium fredii CCBAU 25509]